MADKIQLNSTELLHAVAMAQLSGLALNGSLDTWDKQGEKMDAMEAFAEQYVELERAVALLEDLVVKDARDIRQVGLKMMLQESNIAKIWELVKK